jgi:hypothetical protein
VAREHWKDGLRREQVDDREERGQRNDKNRNRKPIALWVSAVGSTVFDSCDMIQSRSSRARRPVILGCAAPDQA